MDATDLADALRRSVEKGDALPARDGFDGLDVTGAHEDSDFFVELETGEKFLVAVMKVSE